MRLKCYIVDDEKAAAENLQLLLDRHCPETLVAGHALTINEALHFLRQNEMDILFLDIRMQNETGFDLLRQLENTSASVVFVTAYDEYGIQAIKFSATDYLLKPVHPQELIAAVNKAGKRKKATDNTRQLNMLLQSFENLRKQEQKRIALPDASEIRYVLLDDIVCCKSDNSYTTFYIHGRNNIIVSKPISDYETILEPYGFVRVHQSYLINKNRMISFKKEDGGYLLMENNIQVPVSRQRKHLLRDLF